MVACEVCEDAAGEVESPDALLCHAVTAYFHESVCAALVRHLPEQPVQRDGVGRRHFRVDGFAVDVVADSAAESALVAKLPEDVVKDCGDCCLAVRAGDANEMHPLRGVAEEVCRKDAHHILCVGIDKIGDAFVESFGQLFADDGRGSQFDGLWDEVVSVDLCATHGDEEAACLDLAAVYLDARHFPVSAADGFLRRTVVCQL